MIASDLRNIADTADIRAGLAQPLGVAELHALAATLRSLADRAAVLESLPVPKQHRFTVVDGGAA